MPGLSKITRSGISYIKKVFTDNPNISYTDLTIRYNEKAHQEGWKTIRSNGTLRYHLKKHGLLKDVHRAVFSSPKKGNEIILIPSKTRHRIAEMLHVSTVNVSQALRYQRNSDRAKVIRKIALEMGGVEYIRKEVINQ